MESSFQYELKVEQPTLNQGASSPANLNQLVFASLKLARPTWPPGCIRKGWYIPSGRRSLKFHFANALPLLTWASPICACQAYYYLTTQLSDITQQLLPRQSHSKPGRELGQRYRSAFRRPQGPGLLAVEQVSGRDQHHKPLQLITIVRSQG